MLSISGGLRRAVPDPCFGRVGSRCWRSGTSQSGRHPSHGALCASALRTFRRSRSGRSSGPAGIAVETINEAAKRAGVSLQWVETGTSSDEAFRRGLVDLWPIMADLPDRRKLVHITQAVAAHQSHPGAAPGRNASGPRLYRPHRAFQDADSRSPRAAGISGSATGSVRGRPGHHKGSLQRYSRRRLYGASRGADPQLRTSRPNATRRHFASPRCPTRRLQLGVGFHL